VVILLPENQRPTAVSGATGGKSGSSVSEKINENNSKQYDGKPVTG
jgi:hypothetical protein